MAFKSKTFFIDVKSRENAEELWRAFIASNPRFHSRGYKDVPLSWLLSDIEAKVALGFMESETVATISGGGYTRGDTLVPVDHFLDYLNYNER